MADRLLLALPAAAVGVVLWLVLLAWGPTSVVGVEVLGGDRSATPPSSLLLRAVRLTEGRREPLPGVRLELLASTAEQRATWRGSTDDTGHAEVELSWRAGGVATVRVTRANDPGDVLADGRAAAIEDAAPSPRAQGQWLGARKDGALEIDVAPARGVLAVPFDDELLVRVRARESPAGGPAANADAPVEAEVEAEVEVRADGALLGASEPADAASPDRAMRARGTWKTDAHGRLRLGLRPEQHALSLEVEARSSDGRRGRWYGALPVVPGALDARRVGRELIVRSPIPRDVAFVSLRSSSRRLWGAVIRLGDDERGGASGRVELPPRVEEQLTQQPVWAITSSAHDKRSAGVVGWPISPPSSRPTPGATREEADVLLVDGPAQVLLRAREALREQRRLASMLLFSIGLGLALVLWQRIRLPAADAAMAAKGAPKGNAPGGNAPQSAEDARLLRSTLSSGGWRMAVAIACVIVGLGALALFGTIEH